MVRDFDDNEFPLAYFISFRTYGTWLHGDDRGSVDRRRHNKYGTPKIAARRKLVDAERAQLKHPPVKLDAYQRPVVEAAIREVCKHRGSIDRNQGAYKPRPYCGFSPVQT